MDPVLSGMTYRLELIAPSQNNNGHLVTLQSMWRSDSITDIGCYDSIEPYAYFGSFSETYLMKMAEFLHLNFHEYYQDIKSAIVDKDMTEKFSFVLNADLNTLTIFKTGVQNMKLLVIGLTSINIENLDPNDINIWEMMNNPNIVQPNESWSFDLNEADYFLNSNDISLLNSYQNISTRPRTENVGTDPIETDIQNPIDDDETRMLGILDPNPEHYALNTQIKEIKRKIEVNWKRIDDLNEAINKSFEKIEYVQTLNPLTLQSIHQRNECILLVKDFINQCIEQILRITSENRLMLTCLDNFVLHLTDQAMHDDDPDTSNEN